MITELVEKYLKVKSLEARKEQLEEEIAERERELELMDISKEEAVGASGFSEYTHVFAVTGAPGNTFLTAAEGDTRAAARDNLRSRIPATCKIHCHIGEINQMVCTIERLK